METGQRVRPRLLVTWRAIVVDHVSSAGPWAGISLIMAQIPMLARAPGGWLLDDVIPDDDRRAQIGKRL
jgi:hypothetical protein